MTEQQVTVPLPENLYLRLKQVAQATQQSFTDVLIHAVEMGSPPSWETAPSEFQEDLAPLDRLNDEALWQIARSHKTEADMERYQELLDKNADGTLTEGERVELVQMRTEADRFMLRKAHAAALLRWRGHKLPPPEKM
jgi:NADP-dependent 3-hydroxy acid dehydrogenase YdfG